MKTFTWRGRTPLSAAVWVALLVGVSAAGVKNVAVVETEIDAQSGASAKLNKAEVRQITAELRSVAVKNLPRDRYNVMTSETVYAQGSARLEECAEENCVIALGSKIGADYIVRGIISQLGTSLTLSVEMYETEDGNLVATSGLVRTGSVMELVDKAAGVCADMYKIFVSSPSNTQQPRSTQSAIYTVTVNINPVNGGLCLTQSKQDALQRRRTDSANGRGLRRLRVYGLVGYGNLDKSDHMGL